MGSAPQIIVFLLVLDVLLIGADRGRLPGAVVN